jgi:hypothetical protein
LKNPFSGGELVQKPTIIIFLEVFNDAVLKESLNLQKKDRKMEQALTEAPAEK